MAHPGISLTEYPLNTSPLAYCVNPTWYAGNFLLVAATISFLGEPTDGDKTVKMMLGGLTVFVVPQGVVEFIPIMVLETDLLRSVRHI